MKAFFSVLTIASAVALLPAASMAQTAKSLPSYRGVPKTDVQFTRFIQSHANQVVVLDLKIANPNEYDNVTYGYRGVSPTFYMASLGKQDYEVFIDCDRIDNQNTETTIGRCAPYVNWNERTGRLSGKFKVIHKGKNGMGSRLIFLEAVK